MWLPPSLSQCQPSASTRFAPSSRCANPRLRRLESRRWTSFFSRDNILTLRRVLSLRPLDSWETVYNRGQVDGDAGVGQPGGPHWPLEVAPSPPASPKLPRRRCIRAVIVALERRGGRGRGIDARCCPCVRLGLAQRQHRKHTARGGGFGYGINGETVVATAPEADVSRLPALPSPVGSPVSLPDGVLCWAVSTVRCRSSPAPSGEHRVDSEPLTRTISSAPAEVLRSCTWQRRRAWAVGTDQLLPRRRGDDADSSVALGRAAVWQGCGFVNSTVLCKRTRRCGSRPQLHRAAPALARRRVGCPPPTVHTENHRFEGAACCSQLSAPTHLSPPFVDRVQSLLLTGTTYLCIMLTKRASGPSGQAPASTLYKARIYLAAFDDGLRHNV